MNLTKLRNADTMHNTGILEIKKNPDWEGYANNMSLNMALDAYSKGKRVH